MKRVDKELGLLLIEARRIAKSRDLIQTVRQIKAAMQWYRVETERKHFDANRDLIFRDQTKPRTT